MLWGIVEYVLEMNCVIIESSFKLNKIIKIKENLIINHSLIVIKLNFGYKI